MKRDPSSLAVRFPPRGISWLRSLALAFILETARRAKALTIDDRLGERPAQ
jgi:hypothetical protein